MPATRHQVGRSGYGCIIGRRAEARYDGRQDSPIYSTKQPDRGKLKPFATQDRADSTGLSGAIGLGQDA
jgi:hypothetical protein